LVNPFRWEHVLIPVLPDICEGYLEAPVPFLIGIPKDYKENKEFFNIVWSRDTLIVVLDEGKVYFHGPDPKSLKNSPLPKLKGLKEQIAKGYKAFESETELRYSPSEKQIKAIRSIQQAIEKSFNKLLLNQVNKANYKELLNESTKELNIDAAKKLLKKVSHNSDIEFLEKFCETQMLAGYIKEKYENKATS